MATNSVSSEGSWSPDCSLNPNVSSWIGPKTPGCVLTAGKCSSNLIVLLLWSHNFYDNLYRTIRLFANSTQVFFWCRVFFKATAVWRVMSHLIRFLHQWGVDPSFINHDTDLVQFQAQDSFILFTYTFVLLTDHDSCPGWLRIHSNIRSKRWCWTVSMLTWRDRCLTLFFLQNVAHVPKVQRCPRSRQETRINVNSA